VPWWRRRRRDPDEDNPFRTFKFEPPPPLPEPPEWLLRAFDEDDPLPRHADTSVREGFAPPEDSQDAESAHSTETRPETLDDDLPQLANISPDWSYAEDLPAGTACLDCTRWHLWAMLMALRRAETADGFGRRQHMVQAAGEYAVMKLFDWAPPKLAASPPAHRAAVETAQAALANQVPWPPLPLPLVTAWAAVAEAVRFARSPTVTEADRREIRQRLDTAEALLVDQERVAPPRAPTREAVLSALRQARHELDSGPWDDPNRLERAAAALLKAAVQATDAPDPSVVRECRRAVEAAHQTFRRAMLDALRQPVAR